MNKKFVIFYIHNHEISALRKISYWLIKFSPLVSIVNTNSDSGLLIDLTGTDRLYKNPLELVEKIVKVLVRAGLSVRVGFAPTPGAAWALARYGIRTINVASAKNLQIALKDLPVAALRISTDTVDKLFNVGIKSIGQLSSLPRRSLLDRFGYQLIKRLDQTFGAIEESFQFISEPKKYYIETDFDTPLTQKLQLQSAILTILKRLTAQLRQDSKQAGSFRIDIRCYTGQESELSNFEKELSLQHATRNFAHVSSVIQPVLETIMFSGNIDSLRVEACNVTSCSTEQADFIDGYSVLNLKRAAEELINLIIVKLGKQSVCKAQLRQSYVPERSFSYEPEGGINDTTLPPFLPKDRPPYLLPKPKQISAVSNPGAPEKITEEWWHRVVRGNNKTLREREYFKVKDRTGRWLWVFKNTSSQEWFVHGAW